MTTGTRVRRPVAVVPAAGRSRRFGAPKLAEPVDGTPMIARTVRSLLDGGVEAVVIVLAGGGLVDARHPAVAPVLVDPRVSAVVNPDPGRGMFSSIQTGLAQTDGDPILIQPADMPFVRPETVADVLAAALERDDIVSPRFEGQRGHPIALPARLRPAILDADPSSDLSTVLEPFKSSRIEIDVDDRGILRDVDRPGDLATDRGDRYDG